MGSQQAKRALIVEDEFLVAMFLEDVLGELGYNFVECATDLAEATRIASETDLDLAVLDVNMRGFRSFSVARILRARGIPLVFATGYGKDGLEEDCRHEITLQKPFQPIDLAQAINEAQARAARS